MNSGMLMSQAEMAYRQKHYQQAIMFINRAIKLKKDIESYYFLRGRCKEKLGQLQAAIEDYTKGIRLNFKDLGMLFCRAHTKIALQDYRGAIDDFSKILSLDSKYPDAFLCRGICEYNLHNYSKALPDFQEALAQNNGDTKAKLYEEMTVSALEKQKAMELQKSSGGENKKKKKKKNKRSATEAEIFLGKATDLEKEAEQLQQKEVRTQTFAEELSEKTQKINLMQEEIESFRKKSQNYATLKNAWNLQKKQGKIKAKKINKLEDKLNNLKSKIKGYTASKEELKTQKLEITKLKLEKENLILRIHELENALALKKNFDCNRMVPHKEGLIINKHHRINLPLIAVKMMLSLTESGCHALIVGGAVRDLLLGRAFFDLDIITDMPSSVILEKFKGSVYVVPYVSGLYQVRQNDLKVDVFTCAEEVFVSRNAFILDAKKRAFSINGLYCDIQGRIYDPLNRGIVDLLHKPKLALIHKDFSLFERDPVLLLRASRLSVRYDLEISSQLKKTIGNYSNFIKKLEAKRLHIELKRHFLEGYALKNVQCLIDLGLFKILFPQIMLFINDAKGIKYKEWMHRQLSKTDEFFIDKNAVSMNYVYGILFLGSLLQQESMNEKTDFQAETAIETILQEYFGKEEVGAINRINHRKKIISYVQRLLCDFSSETDSNQALDELNTTSGPPIVRQFQSYALPDSRDALSSGHFPSLVQQRLSLT